MFQSLAVNTLVSATAFFVTSVVGLLLVPLLVSAYGMEAFGIIALLRLFLPTGVLAVLDFGFSEIATLAVAQARVDGSWRRAGGQITLLFCLGLGVGALVAMGLTGYADLIGAALNIGPQYIDSFIEAIRVTGLCLLFLYPILVFDGILKGFEAYRLLRFIETVTTLGYAGAVVLIINAKMDFSAAYYALLGSMLVKGAALIVFSFRVSWKQALFGARVDRERWREVMNRCRLLSWNKVLGALQTQAPALLIGVLLTSAAVGIYDIVVRLPRFMKSVLGLLNSALLPFATKLDSTDDIHGMRRLGQTGLLTVAAVSAPVLFAGCAFSEPILRLWIGPEMESYWKWQSLMFIVPVLTVLISFGGVALMKRERVMRRMNLLMTLQLLLQFALSFLLLGVWQERAFIFGQVVALIIMFYPQMQVIFREQRLDKILVRQLFSIAGLGFLFLFSVLSLGFPFVLGDIFVLTLAVVVWTVIFWVSIYLFVFTVRQRVRLREMLA